MLTIIYPISGPTVNVLLHLSDAIELPNRSIKTLAGVLLRAHPLMFLLLFIAYYLNDHSKKFQVTFAPIGAI